MSINSTNWTDLITGKRVALVYVSVDGAACTACSGNAISVLLLAFALTLILGCRMSRNTCMTTPVPHTPRPSAIPLLMGYYHVFEEGGEASELVGSPPYYLLITHLLVWNPNDCYNDL